MLLENGSNKNLRKTYDANAGTTPDGAGEPGRRLHGAHAAIHDAGAGGGIPARQVGRGSIVGPTTTRRSAGTAWSESTTAPGCCCVLGFESRRFGPRLNRGPTHTSKFSEVFV